MSFSVGRLSLFDKDGNPLGDLAPSDLLGKCPLFEKVNGQHTLTLVTRRVLKEGTRVVFADGTGKYREYVVNAPDELHDKGEHAIGTYGCIWSMQYDLMGVYASEHAEPGMGSSCSGHHAVECAIDGTSRWSVGTVDVDDVAAGKGVVMIGISAWERLSLVVAAWGGEADAEIEVDHLGVVARRVALRRHLGSTVVRRRFDWSHDLKSIRRTPDQGPYYCGIVPLGRGQTEYAEDDETTFEWPIDITEETPHGEDYILDDEAKEAFKVWNGTDWEYPKKVVRYDEDDPELLYAAALADVEAQTHPSVTYESDVMQLARAGMDAHGIELGDEVCTVDRGFNPDVGLRIQGRVLEMEADVRPEVSDMRVVIGQYVGTMGDFLRDYVSQATAEISNRLAIIENGKNGSLVYLKTLLDAINAELNVTGGYYYLVPGCGIYTYDRAVSDPTVGTEATAVTQIVGGGIRIANSRTAQGDWDWKSVFVSGHVLAELVTAVQITAGYIGNPSGDFYINFDTHEYRLGAMAQIGGRSVQDVLDTVDATITAVDVQYAQNQSNTVAPVTGWTTTAPTWQEGYYIWQRTVKTTNSGTTYSQPTCISGREGADGVGITSIEEQYYLSTSNTTQTGGSWSSTQPTWESGKYIWMRSKVTWDNGSITFTTPTLGNAVNALGERVQAISIKNMTPFFENEPTVGEYWTRIEKYWSGSGTGSFAITKLEDGWAHVAIHATSGYLQQGVILCVATDASDVVDGTLLVEVKNRATTSTQGTDFSIYSDGQLRSKSWSGSTYTVSFDGDTELRLDMVPSGTSSPVAWMHFMFLHKSGSSPTSSDLELEFDVRMSYYAQLGYEGGYIPYSTAGLSVSEVQSIASDVAASAVASQTQNDIFNKLTNNGQLQGLYMSDGNLYVNASFIKTGELLADIITSGKIQSANGKVYFDLTNNTLVCDKIVSTDNISTVVSVGSSSVSVGGSTYSYSGLLVKSGSSDTQGIVLRPGSSSVAPLITSTNKRMRVECPVSQGGNLPGGVAGMIVTESGYTIIHGGTRRLSDSDAISSYTNNDLGRIICHPAFQGYSSPYSTDGTVEIEGNFEAGRATIYELIVTGPKNRAASTEDYGDRLLYSYETPTPMFGDVGSGVIGEDGTCYIEIDDVFSETARVDLAYQVFLQKCGAGDVWVAEKHATYFVVSGTPNLPFDWEIKARQAGLESYRLENWGLAKEMEDSTGAYASSVENMQISQAESYLSELENIYD